MNELRLPALLLDPRRDPVCLEIPLDGEVVAHLGQDAGLGDRRGMKIGCHRIQGASEGGLKGD